MHICTVIYVKDQSLYAEENKYVFKRDIDDDSDGAHLTSFGLSSRQMKKQRKTSDHQVLT